MVLILLLLLLISGGGTYYDIEITANTVGSCPQCS